MRQRDPWIERPGRAGSRIRRRAAGFVLLLPALLLARSAAAAAATPLVLDESAFSTSPASGISDWVIASDIATSTPQLLFTATVWLQDGVANDNGVLDSFDGAISWAIYDSASGHPGNVLASGTDHAPTVVDTGIDCTAGACAPGKDIARVTIHFPGGILLYGLSTYWLGLREGTWGAAYDGSQVYWAYGNSAGATEYGTSSYTNPISGGAWSDVNYDRALHLAGAPVRWDLAPETGPVTDESDCSSLVDASWLPVSSSETLSAGQLWIADGAVNDNGTLDFFSHKIGWALYSDSSGHPGSILASGTDSSPVETDTGAQDAYGSDIVRVTFHFGRSLELAPGNYWLAVREGAWGSGYDGSQVYLIRASLASLHGPDISADLANPGSGSSPWQTLGFSLAFLVFDDTLFADGFEAARTCAFSSAAGGACP